MTREIEAKFRVDNFTSVRRALKREGAEYLETALQTDLFFDTPDRSLRDADCGLRIRLTRTLRRGRRRSDNRPLVTYKGPRSKGRKTKSRLEYQTRVDDAEALAHILEGCSLLLRMTIQKRRASYRLGTCLVELDELPLIGRFVEIEGPGGVAIEKVRKALALDDDPIVEPYFALLSAFCPRADNSCRAATFELCGRCRYRPRR